VSIDRIALYCACLAGCGLITTVILAALNAPTAAYTAAGGIGTTTAAATAAYLRRPGRQR